MSFFVNDFRVISEIVLQAFLKTVERHSIDATSGSTDDLSALISNLEGEAIKELLAQLKFYSHQQASHLQKSFEIEVLEISTGYDFDFVKGPFEQNLLNFGFFMLWAFAEHLDVVVQNFKTGIRQGQYGEKDKVLWDRNITPFIETKLMAFIGNMDAFPKQKKKGLSQELLHCVELLCSVYLYTNEDPDVPDTDLTGRRFERACMDVLSARGWECQQTPASGDRGADIVAKRGDVISMVVQCKDYTNPVGNSAVQEIFAAKKIYDADIAIVVTNSTYTLQARQDAQMLGVKLITYGELHTI